MDANSHPVIAGGTPVYFKGLKGQVDRFIAKSKRFRVSFPELDGKVLKFTKEEIMEYLKPKLQMKCNVSAVKRFLSAKIKMPKIGEVTLIGNSRAADCTTFTIPELRVALDAGIMPNKKSDNIFITHVHSDHCYALPYHRSRTSCPTTYCPASSVEHLKLYMDASQALSLNCTMEEMFTMKKESRHAAEISYIGVNAGEEFLVDKKRSIWVRTYDMDHGVACVGYEFSIVKKKLKEEYTGLKGREIGKLKKQGIEITKDVRTTIFTFLGDTTCEALRQNPEILNTPILIIECSFLEDDQALNAARSKHVHWPNLREYVKENPDTLFILIHFSQRYSECDIREFFLLDENHFSNVLPWVPTTSNELYTIDLLSDIFVKV